MLRVNFASTDVLFYLSYISDMGESRSDVTAPVYPLKLIRHDYFEKVMLLL